MEAREYVVEMTLPATGSPQCYDTTGTQPITQLETLDAYAVSFNRAYPETIRAWIGVAGLEGQRVGVVWDILAGRMGVMYYRTRNPMGWSCWHSFVFAVPYEEAPPDTTPPPGPGLAAEYYDDIDFTVLYDAPTDSVIVFTWPGSPLLGMGADQFSVRWTGTLTSPTTGTYRICPEGCRGGYRFWMDGALLSESDSPANCGEICKQVAMVAGVPRPIVAEYWHTDGTATVRVRWITPLGQDQYIPASAWR